jgi:hypothetical protein
VGGKHECGHACDVIDGVQVAAASGQHAHVRARLPREMQNLAKHSFIFPGMSLFGSKFRLH